MKVIRITSTGILSLLLGIAAPGYAQQEQHNEKQDHQQQGKHEQAKPQQQHAQHQRQSDQQQRQPQHAQQQQSHEQQGQQQHAQQLERQDQNKQQHAQQQRQDNQSQHAQQRRGNEQPQRTRDRQLVRQSAWQQHRAQNWRSDHRTWQERGGYHGYRIPDARFRGYFGPEHGFRIHGRPFLVVGRYPRFQYNGYWFSLIDPWPEYWANDWYDTDDVYVTYVDNGYYLFNRRHPTVGIAISISL
jgi:hypothetical protein